MGWIFLVLFYVQPGILPTVLIYGPYQTKGACEKARWALQLQNSQYTYVRGCEEWRVRK